jgi:archaellum biogenesis ATPase FlaH
LIDKEGNVLNISKTQQVLKRLQSDQEERIKQIEAEEKQTATRQYLDILSRLQIVERDQLAIFDSLTEALKFEGTCRWTLQQESIASWLDAKGRVQSIWLHGSAGTGKSVLSAHLITFKRSNSTSRIIYHL